MTFTRHDDPAVQLLLDRAAIHDLVMRYASGVDKRDFETVESCFVPDVDASSWGFTDRDSLMSLIRGVAVFHTTMHMMGNQFIGVSGDRASADTYAMLTHHTDGTDGEPFELNMSGNRYIEKLRRADTGWVIYQRGGEPAWSAIATASADSDDATVRWLLDRAEIHDVLMQYALGIDLCDYDRIRNCFATGFDASYGLLGRFTEIEDLIDLIRGVEYFESTTHFLGSQLIEVHGDRGLAETPAMITHRESKDGRTEEWMLGASRYIDELIRVKGRWKIAGRGEHVERVPTAGALNPDSGDAAVDWLLDRAQIHDVIVTSALAVDRADWELYASCFDDTPADLSGLCEERERWDSTCHFPGNQLIDIARDTAQVETYIYVTHRESPEARATPWSKGARRFCDRLVKRDGRWKIIERKLVDNKIVGERG